MILKTLLKVKSLKENVEITLSDIGFDNMIRSILNEYRKNVDSEDENPGI